MKSERKVSLEPGGLERGVSLVEYALLLALVITVLLVFRSVFWASVVRYYSGNTNQFNYINTPVYVP